MNVTGTRKSLRILGWSAAVLVLCVTVPSVTRGHSGPHGGVDNPPEPSGTSPFPVIAEGLSNPRDILIDAQDCAHEVIYVAEAGAGGHDPCIDSYNGDYHDCYGPTGAITRITAGVVDRFVTGLPSLAGPNGGFSVGPSHLALRGSSLYVVVANAGLPESREIMAGADSRFGHILEINRRGRIQEIADLSAFEDAYNPDGAEHIESNPRGLALGPAGGWVALDAAGNTVLKVKRDGTVALRHVFPTRDFPAPPFLGLPPGAMLPVQSVPTAIVKGPDGAYYVAEFTGFPYPPGAARVFRFSGDAAPTVFADGFTNVIDIDFGPDGSLYVLEMATNGLLSQNVTGAVIRVTPNGVRTVVASQGLVYPTAIAVSRHGDIYVTNYGVSGSKAQLVRL